MGGQGSKAEPVFPTRLLRQRLFLRLERALKEQQHDSRQQRRLNENVEAWERGPVRGPSGVLPDGAARTAAGHELEGHLTQRTRRRTNGGGGHGNRWHRHAAPERVCLRAVCLNLNTFAVTPRADTLETNRARTT